MFNSKIKLDFPLFNKYPNLIYLDNAATSQKPQIVIDALSQYYREFNFPIFKGYSTLSQKSQNLFFRNKKDIANFFHLSTEQLIFIPGGTTLTINLLANSLINKIKVNSTIVLSVLEHHANLLIWQKLAKKKNLKIEFIPLEKNGLLDLIYLKQLLNSNPNISLFSLVYVSNVMGLINPMKKIGQLIDNYRQKKTTPTYFFIDGAQAVSHLNFNFNHLKADGLFFSSHKMLGPLGLGVLLVSKNFLNQSEPFFLGGGIVQQVNFENYQLTLDQNQKFLAGSLDGASIYSLKIACQYLAKFKMSEIQTNTQKLIDYAYQKLTNIKNIVIVGGQKNRLNLISFYFTHYDSFEIASFLINQNILIRSGYHCAQPIHQYLKIPQTLRLSLQLYNTSDDIDQLIKQLKIVPSLFTNSFQIKANEKSKC